MTTRATTLQFRDAVNQAASHCLVTVLNSWTNGSKKGMVETGIRTVKMELPAYSVEAVARKAEDILAEDGLTADTRFTKAKFGGSYIRGTCDFKV